MEFNTIDRGLSSTVENRKPQVLESIERLCACKERLYDRIRELELRLSPIMFYQAEMPPVVKNEEEKVALLVEKLDEIYRSIETSEDIITRMLDRLEI